MDSSRQREEQRIAATERVTIGEANAIAQLLGETIVCSGWLLEKQITLMHGLCRLVNASGWNAWTWPQESPPAQGPEKPQVENRGTEIIATKRISPREIRTLRLFRGEDETRFSARETRLAAIILEEIRWLYEIQPDAPDDACEPELSPRETDVLELLRQGLDRKHIAHILTLSPHTVAGYQKRIYRKFGVQTQIALMRGVSRKPEGAT